MSVKGIATGEMARLAITAVLATTRLGASPPPGQYRTYRTGVPAPRSSRRHRTRGHAYPGVVGGNHAKCYRQESGHWPDGHGPTTERRARTRAALRGGRWDVDDGLLVVRARRVVRGYGGVGDGTVSVPAPAPGGGVAVPLPVLNRVNGVTVSRVWVPVLQVPTVAGARVTVSTPVTFSLPAQWQAPGMPDWRQTPWASRGVTKRAGARRKQDGRRDNRLRAAHRGFGARFGGGPGRRATPRCDPARTGISGGRFAPKLFCIDNPPMGGHSPLCRAAA